MFNSKTIKDLQTTITEFAKKNIILTAIIVVVIIFCSYSYISGLVRKAAQPDISETVEEIVIDTNFLIEQMQTNYFIGKVAELKPIMTAMTVATNEEIEFLFSNKNKKTDDDIRKELKIRENPMDSNGKRLIPVYEGARWFGSEKRDLGRTEAESIPNGLMQDEIIITLLTYNLKHGLYTSHEVSEKPEGVTAYVPENEMITYTAYDFITEEDVEKYYNGLPFWNLRTRSEVVYCESENCRHYEVIESSLISEEVVPVLGVDEETGEPIISDTPVVSDKTIEEKVTVYYCPGHYWTVCNILISFEPRMRDFPLYNEDGSPKTDDWGDPLFETRLFGGLESVWDMMNFNSEDTDNYMRIKRRYNEIIAGSSAN